MGPLIYESPFNILPYLDHSIARGQQIEQTHLGDPHSGQLCQEHHHMNPVYRHNSSRDCSSWQ